MVQLCVLDTSVCLVSTALSNLVPKEIFLTEFSIENFCPFSPAQEVPGRVSTAFEVLLKMNFSDLSSTLHIAHELQHKVHPQSKVYLHLGTQVY